MNRPDNQGVSRRDLFKRSLVGAAGLYGTGALEGAADAGADGKYPKEPGGQTEYEFTAQSGALQPDKVVVSACQFCNSNCRLKVHLKAGRVIDITGETTDPVQASGLCVKGPMMAQLVYNRHRLTRPMKRVAGRASRNACGILPSRVLGPADPGGNTGLITTGFFEALD